MTDYNPLNYHETEEEIVSTLPFSDVALNRPIKSFDFNHLVDVIGKKKWHNPL